MKRPYTWIHWLILAVLLLVTAETIALTWVAPRRIIEAVGRAAGGELLIGRARLAFPLTTRLEQLRLADNTETSALSIQAAVLKPRWLSPTFRTLWVDSLRVERPFLRLTRTEEGTFLWPALERLVRGEQEAAAARRHRFAPLTQSWRAHFRSIEIVNGIIEFIDYKPETPFHAVLSHLSVQLGPVTLEPDRTKMTVAVRGKFTGFQGHAAPFVCSGWIDTAAKDLEASCELKPLTLVAFDPYYHGKVELRVYTTTVASTSQWVARNNQFTGRVRLQFDQLSEGDLSIRGRTIVDLKQIAKGKAIQLNGEVNLTGLLDDPAGWRAELLPGDDRVQGFVTTLLGRGIEALKVTLWGYPLHLSLVPSTQAAMTNMEAASREVQEALEILTVPEAPLEPAPEPAAQPAADGAAPAAPSAPAPAEPAELPELEPGAISPPPPAPAPAPPPLPPAPAPTPVSPPQAAPAPPPPPAASVAPPGAVPPATFASPSPPPPVDAAQPSEPPTPVPASP